MLSALKRLAAAAVGGTWRRKVVVVILLVGALAAGVAIAVHEYTSIDPVTGKKVVSSTNYGNPEGTYGRTVIVYSDGTRREIRTDGSSDSNAGRP